MESATLGQIILADHWMGLIATCGKNWPWPKIGIAQVGRSLLGLLCVDIYSLLLFLGQKWYISSCDWFWWCGPLKIWSGNLILMLGCPNVTMGYGISCPKKSDPPLSSSSGDFLQVPLSTSFFWRSPYNINMLCNMYFLKYMSFVLVEMNMDRLSKISFNFLKVHEKVYKLSMPQVSLHNYDNSQMNVLHCNISIRDVHQCILSLQPHPRMQMILDQTPTPISSSNQPTRT